MLKNASVWVIASGTALSLVLGLVAPVDEAVKRRNASDVAANVSCTPFIANDVRHAEVELRLDATVSRPSFDF